MAKLLACAMLQGEASEFAIYKRLDESRIKIRPVSFNFTAQHLILMFVLIAGMTIVGCYLGLLAFAHGQKDFVGTLQAHELMFLAWPQISWPLATVCVYLLPIILSAGMVMYQLDKRSWEHAEDFTTGFTGGVMVFLGSAGLAFLAILTYAVGMLAIGNGGIGDFHILTLVPWSLPAATVATLFLFMSTRTWCLDKWSGIAVDAIIHGGGAAAASECALLLGTLAGDTFPSVPAGMMPFLAPISAGVIGASIGAVLCASTRQRVHAVGKARSPDPTMPMGALAPAE
jgi:hypothetical protein